MLFYIPQLVQATRYDDLGYVKEFIKKISKESNLVAHQLIWNIQTNMFRSVEVGKKSVQLSPPTVILATVTQLHSRYTSVTFY